MGGTTLAYAVDALLMAAAVLVLLSVRHRSPRREVSTEPVLSSITGGLRFVFGEPILLSALTLDLFSVLFGGATALLPLFAAEILGAGPGALGMLRAAPAAGAVVASVLLTRWPPFARTGRNLLMAVSGFGVCSIGFGLSTTLWLSIALLAVGGACDMVSVVIRSLMLQARTPEALLGRVSSVNQKAHRLPETKSVLLTGLTARWWGRWRVVVGGCATLGVVAMVAWRMSLRRLHRCIPSAKRVCRAAQAAPVAISGQRQLDYAVARAVVLAKSCAPRSTPRMLSSVPMCVTRDGYAGATHIGRFARGAVSVSARSARRLRRWPVDEQVSVLRGEDAGARTRVARDRDTDRRRGAPGLTA
jgi:hypothetical protein